MITQKQQAIAITALSNMAMLAMKRTGIRQDDDVFIRIFKDALTQVRHTAVILTDEEIVELAAMATQEIMLMPVTDVKITPDPTVIPLQ